jgi:hypothetical protein
MRRKLIILFTPLVAVAAGVAPVSLAIWLAYQTTVESAETKLRSISQTIAADTSKILQDVDQGLIALYDLSFDCSAEDVSAMNTMTYDIPEISDIGIMRPDRKLVCTSWGPIKPPVEPELPPPESGFRLIGPLKIKLMKRYGLVALRKWENGPEIGALLHPSVLIGRLGADSAARFAVLLRRARHAFLCLERQCARNGDGGIAGGSGRGINATQGTVQGRYRTHVVRRRTGRFPRDLLGRRGLGYLDSA